MPLEASVLAVATTAFAWSEVQQKRLCCRAARKETKVWHCRVRGWPSSLLSWGWQGQCASYGVQGCTDVRCLHRKEI